MAEVASDAGGTASALPDDVLLEELKRRGLMPPTAPGRGRLQVQRVTSPPGSRTHSPESYRSGADDGPCLVELGPVGGPLAPRLVTDEGKTQVFRILETGGLRGSVDYTWHCEDAAQGKGHHKRVARLHGELGSAFGRTCVHVCRLDGTEVFTLKDSYSPLNPTHVRWSYRVLPPDTDDEAQPLFTVNKDIIGRGFMGSHEQWRVFRGRARDGELLYYGIAWALAWKYQFYRSQADYDAGQEPVAELEQAAATGVRCEETGVWLPAEFDLKVSPGEDAGLLLALSTILDAAHGHSQPPSVI